jgi:hypothetical protein
MIAEAKSQGKSPQVSINLEDKRQEDYRAPTPPPYVAYSGQGSVLGESSNPTYIFIPSTFPPTAPSTDDSKSCTTLQVKLHDGKKLKLKYIICYYYYYHTIILISLMFTLSTIYRLNLSMTVQDLAVTIHNRYYIAIIDICDSSSMHTRSSTHSANMNDTSNFIYCTCNFLYQSIGTDPIYIICRISSKGFR